MLMKNVKGVAIPMTAEEVDAYNFAQAEWDAGADQRALDEALSKRRGRYRSESDSLYLEAQYTGDPADLQEWRDTVAQIKLDIPLPTI